MNALNSQAINIQAVGQSAVFAPTFLELVIPEFSYSHTDAVPTVRAEYPVNNTVGFSIRRPMPDEVEENLTFGLAVRYTITTGETVRYCLFKPRLMDGLLYPSYSGQRLGPSAVIEIWSMPGEPDMESAGFTLYAGPMKFITAQQFCFCGQPAADSLTLTGTAV